MSDHGFDFPFGATRAEATERRHGACKGERCTLCGNDAATKVEEDTFGEARHPLTAYVCITCFGRIMMPYRHGRALERQRLRLRLARAQVVLAKIKSAISGWGASMQVAHFDDETILRCHHVRQRLRNRRERVMRILQETRAELGLSEWMP